jgi:hypothetical protein
MLEHIRGLEERVQGGTEKGGVFYKAGKEDAYMRDMMRKMVEAQARATTVEDILGELTETFDQQIGYRLYSLSVFEGGAELTSRRIWTSHPTEYPVNGTKSKPYPEWVAQVIDRQQSFLCRDKADVKRVFLDYEAIFELGCGSVLNVPVRLFGSVIGTVNLLHEEHWFTPERVEKAEAMVALVYTPMLLARWPNLTLEGEAL